MSGKKNKQIRKVAAQIAQQLPDRNYQARVGRVHNAGDFDHIECRVTGHSFVRSEVRDFPRNKMRVAKKYVAEKMKEYEKEKGGRK